MCTPIQKLNKKQNNNKFFIKRDDLLPFSFGGNKARKAEKFFNEIDKNDIDVVVTYGSSSSNHCRIVSNLCYARNIECIIVSPEDSHETQNTKLIQLAEAKLIYCSVDKVSKTIDKVLFSLSNSGKKSYFIPGGGHSNHGTAAYVECFDEIVQYEEKNNVYFDYIFFASGTGTTQAGLICGALKNERNIKINGISIARKKIYGTSIIKKSVETYLDDDFNGSINLYDNWLVGGYGTYNDSIMSTVKNVYLTEGIALDYTYTGKAFYGMIEYIKNKNIQGRNILFIHTGGTPLFFDTLKEL